ncbi:MAG TPA: response regulator [Nitrososphaeraceae archaeon]|jgi:DNA-binding NtrC family response regulator
MSNAKRRRLKIMILEDEEDILTLYKDYLLGRGHDVVSTYLTANNVMSEFGEKFPDVCLVDYRLPGKTNGLDAATEILNKFPSMPILFITAYEPLVREIKLNPFLEDKKISVLVKPVMLEEIEKTMTNLVNG